jgi:hypothetical protein
VAPARLHTLLALLGRAPPRSASGDNGDDDQEEEGVGAGSGGKGKAAAPRTCVIVATTALDDATLARLGLLPK